MAWIRHLLEALLNPFFLGLAGLGLVIFIFRSRGLPRSLYRALMVVLIYFFVISTGFLPRGITEAMEKKYPPVEKVEPSIHWVVVLSGGQADASWLPVNSVLYAASLRRLMEGVRLYQQLPKSQLLLSGGGYGADRPESTRLSEVAAMMGIQSQAMVLEMSSVNTADQARALVSIVHQQPFYLVTSALHMPRALALCRKLGLNPVPAATDYTLYWQDERWEKMWIPNPANMVYLSIALHEILGWYWGRIRGEL